MNETVKAALLAERASHRGDVAHLTRRIAETADRLRAYERDLEVEHRRLADIELHLRDNGVDLAAVDAEAEKARPRHDSVLDRNFARALASGYERSQGNINANLGRALSSIGYNDPTAGLAKALDEA